MHQGTLYDDDVQFIFSHCLDRMSQEDRSKFKDALQLEPTWNMIHIIVFKYLQYFTTPVLNFIANLQSYMHNGKIIVPKKYCFQFKIHFVFVQL